MTAPVIRNDEGQERVRLVDRVVSHRPEFLRARAWVLGCLEVARAAKGEFSRGKVSGLELALSLFDAAEADRGSGAVTSELLGALVDHHEHAERELELLERRAETETEVVLLTRSEFSHLEGSLRGLLALIAKRPAPERPRPAGDRVKALVAREPGGPCCVPALRAEDLPADVTGRPRVPGPAL